MKPAIRDNQQEAMMSDILQKAQQHILDLSNRVNDNRLLYHNYQRTCQIVAHIQKVATAIEVDSETTEVASLAGWLHATGYQKNYDRAVSKSIEIAEAFLNSANYPAKKTRSVINCISASKENNRPDTKAAELFLDGLNGFNATNNFFHHRPLLRLEWELVQGRQLPALEWNQIQLQELLRTSFYTPYGKNQFAPMVAQNILMQKSRVEKNQHNKLQLIDQENGQVRKFQGLEKKLPGSATQTYFRTNYRNHINLSAIADNKANIMISVNAILISVIISVLSYQNIPETQPMVLLPVVLFLVTALTSLIFAVLSIRPKVTAHNEGKVNLNEARKNIVFFGNFVNLSLEQFEEAMDAVLRDGELLYGNMTRDLYFLGKVLDKKYRFLTMSYNIFMVGFVATVVSFLAVLFS